MSHIEVRQTDTYKQWFNRLKDGQARARISTRIRKISLGNLGDVKPVGNGVSEARIDYGPGYRLYFVLRGDTMVILLCGGDKSSQQQDISLAKSIARDLKGAQK